MVKIAEITDQKPWWSQGKDFIRYDQSLGRAKPIFFERREIDAIFKEDRGYSGLEVKYQGEVDERNV